jgi:hypothetical protein
MTLWVNHVISGPIWHVASSHKSDQTVGGPGWPAAVPDSRLSQDLELGFKGISVLILRRSSNARRSRSDISEC